MQFFFGQEVAYQMSGWGYNRGPAPRRETLSGERLFTRSSNPYDRDDRRGGGGGGRSPPRGFGRSPPRNVLPTTDKLTIKLLLLYMQRKWDPNTRMLDLSGLRDTEDISEVQPNINNRMFCLRLAECIAKGKEWAQALDSINLGSNRIHTLRHISEAFQKWEVRVQNLALADNRISDFEEIDHLAPLRLREIILLNNPVAKQGNTYHKYVVKRLKTVQLLDMVAVTDWRRQMLPKMPEPADSSVPPESQILIMRMLQMYYSALDRTDWDTVMDAYDKECFFSFAAETTTKMYYGFVRRYHDSMQTEKNHNLRLTGVQRAPAKGVYRGRSPILDFLKRHLFYKIRPKHDINKFKMDAITMGDVLIVTIHGSYSYHVGDDENEFRKSFERVWILRPNRTGSEWPARISNDQLTWRTYQDQPIVMPRHAPPVMDVKAQLMAATRLNAAFADLLLKEASGQLEAALALFKANQAVGAIPPQAFQ